MGEVWGRVSTLSVPTRRRCSPPLEWEILSRQDLIDPRPGPGRWAGLVLRSHQPLPAAAQLSEHDEPIDCENIAAPDREARTGKCSTIRGEPQSPFLAGEPDYRHILLFPSRGVFPCVPHQASSPHLGSADTDRTLGGP